MIRLVIISDGDCPEPRMVALMRPRAAGGFEWTYISRWKQLSRYQGWNVASERWATDLETFGVRPVIELRDGEHHLRVERVGESRATYPDGAPRQWQRGLEASTPIRRALVADLRKFTAQTRCQEKTNANAETK